MSCTKTPFVCKALHCFLYSAKILKHLILRVLKDLDQSRTNDPMLTMFKTTRPRFHSPKCLYIRSSVLKKGIQGCHLSSTSKYPDFSLTFYSFPYPLTDLKKSFLFVSLMVLTVSLQIWGLRLKERICSPMEQILSFKGSTQ